ncbi:lipase family alpha/beta hydrolase [Arthrobacter sp. HS15c]|uniref:lipase family alpha/beta hydrolase n=1 Tax=Arthrobacter sp. HS15c TaxID=3230279 RepID=UPI0034679EA3
MNDDDQSATTKKTGLVVYVPSLQWDPQESHDFLERLKADEYFFGWQFRVYEHGIGYFSKARPREAAEGLAVQIRDWAGEVAGENCPEEIILIGHSLGGLLVREALLQDAEDAARRFIPEPRTPWPSRVSRVVLIASPNAGYEIHRMNRRLRWGVRLASLFGDYMFEQLEEGSEYITDLRLRWFEYMMSEGNPADGRAAVVPDIVQVLGTNDELISEDNILDARFILQAATVKISNAGHDDIVDLRQAGDADARYGNLRQAICGNVPGMGTRAAESQDPVVFIVHGIRSSKTEGWISRLEGFIRRPANPDIEPLVDETDLDWAAAKVIAPTYGYFGAGNFALPWIRRRNARRLLRWYGDNFVTHDPNRMFFVGHSNGTYMLGRSLLNVPSMRFRRIYLAASVLPKEFPWGEIISKQQLGHFSAATSKWKNGNIHCDRGRRDVPVGWLCSMLNGLGSQDVGTGGFDGFDDLASNSMEHRYPGGHGHMLAPKVDKAHRIEALSARMHEIAEFIRVDASHDSPATEEAPIFSRVSRILGKVTKTGALVLAGLIVIAVIAGASWYFIAAGALIYVGVFVANQL